MSRIVSLQAENVKRLHAVNITPNGNLVIVGGKNGQGKTSVLDSIAMALGGADEVPSMPVRRGEAKASIVLDLGDIIVRRSFTAAGGTSLVVENKDKMRASAPQAILDKLTGKVTFDPLAFISMDATKQAATLKKLVGLDLSQLDSQRKKAYDERTLVNREHDREAARFGLMPLHLNAPAEEQSVTEIVAERDAATAHNAQKATLETVHREAMAAVTGATSLRNSVASEIQTLEARLAALRESLKSHDSRVQSLKEAEAKAHASLTAFVPVDVSPINTKLANVTQINGWVRANKAKAEAERAVQAIKAKSEALTSQIAEIDRQKDEALAAVKFPVAGLSFDKDGGVVFNGVPFDQSSAAERMRVSVAIAAAMNPKLRVMLVRDASLLDEDGLAQLAKLAEEFDLQVWAERVGQGAECSVIIEDGNVKGATVAQEGAAA